MVVEILDGLGDLTCQLSCQVIVRQTRLLSTALAALAALAAGTVLVEAAEEDTPRISAESTDLTFVNIVIRSMSVDTHPVIVNADQPMVQAHHEERLRQHQGCFGCRRGS